VSLYLIDEPDNPSRERMTAEGLDELGASLATNGQFQSVAVEERGARYVIIFGHRRYVAAKLKNLTYLRADVYPAGIDHALVMQAGENAHREKVNPAEEGRWLRGIYERECGQDYDSLIARTGLSPSYVEPRLLLAIGDPAVFEAVKAGEISMGVANELNRIKRVDFRAYYLSSARSHGATVKQAKFWVSQAAMMHATENALPPTEQAADQAAPSAPAIVHRCACCAGTHDVHDMELVQVHRYCNKAILEPAMRLHRERSA
jgi:ParB/RepB/Spo0J family partition protein